MAGAKGAKARGLDCDAGFTFPLLKSHEPGGFSVPLRNGGELVSGTSLPVFLLTVCPRLALLQGSAGSASTDLILRERL